MYSGVNTVIYTLQILKAGPSGRKREIHPQISKKEQSINLWQYTGHLHWPPLLRNSTRQRWTVILPNAHRSTEVPQIGLTPRSTLLPPHNSSHCFAFQVLIDALPRHTPLFPLPHPLPPKTLFTFCQRLLSCMFTFKFRWSRQTVSLHPKRPPSLKKLRSAILIHLHVICSFFLEEIWITDGQIRRNFLPVLVTLATGLHHFFHKYLLEQLILLW